MRRWVRALTRIRTGSGFGWRMKVTSQGWFTLGCKWPWFWYSFTGSWVISIAGLETSEHGAGRGSQELRCCCAAPSQEGDQQFPSKALSSRLGNGTRPPHQPELCFSRVLMPTRLDPEELPCLEMLTRSRCHFLDTVVSPMWHQCHPRAMLQLGSAGVQQENTSILQVANWDMGGMESSAHGHTDSFQQGQGASPDPEVQVGNQTKKFPSFVAQPG